jgi:hypothetical protein
MPGICSAVKIFLNSVTPVTSTNAGSTPGAADGREAISLLVNRDWAADTQMAPPIV